MSENTPHPPVPTPEYPPDDQATQIIPRYPSEEYHYPRLDFTGIASSPSRVQRIPALAKIVAVIATAGALLSVGFMAGRHGSSAAVGAAGEKSHGGASGWFSDICADTPEAQEARTKMLYARSEYMATSAAQESSSGDPYRWCVFGTSPNSSLWWGMVHVGEGNPMYRVLIAENGTSDHASRGLVVYRGLPPVTFARDGWVGFLTPLDWTAVRAAAATARLSGIADELGGS